MKVFHFTSPANAELIKVKGLEPRLSLQTIALVGVRQVIWLTTEETTAMTAREAAALLRRHPERQIIARRWMQSDTDEPLVRFTVQLPINDPKLKQYGPWRRKYPDLTLPHPDSRDLKRAMGSWWIYQAPIRSARIIGCQIEQPKLIEPA